MSSSSITSNVPALTSDRVVRLILKPLVFSACLAPLALLAWDAWTHELNANPFNAIVRDTGFWSLRFLCLTIAITPLRWLTGWHPAIRFRRMLGLFAFFYGVAHVLAYVAFDRIAGVTAAGSLPGLAVAAAALRATGGDAVRPFFAIGWVAFAIMVPLAATSTAGAIRRLGGRPWQRLHRLVYPAAIASVVHTYWPFTQAVPRYAAILAIILAIRLMRACRFSNLLYS